MNKGITIKARIGLTMAFLAALLVAIGLLGLFGLSRSNESMRDMYTNQMPSAVDIGNAEIYAARERLALDRAAFMIGTPEAASTLERARSMRTLSDEWWKRYLSLPRGSEEDRLAQEASGKRDALHQVMESFYATVSANDQPKILDGAKRLQAAYNELSTADDTLRKYQFEQAKDGFDSAQSSFSTFRVISIIGLAAGVLAALFSYFTLRSAIARPLSEALGHFDAIASGDLRRPVVPTSRDEMGQLIDGIGKMQRSLTETVRSVRSGSESIATATRQIAAGNIDLSSRTEEQAGTVKQNADNARQASALAANASDIANKGSSVVSQVVGTMGDINQSSAKIADIIAIIEGIAFQTNILALNAAVEAARAGEEGRGFAVVAGEVRSLAQRSSAAAKEIKELIDTSVERVQAGSALVDEAGRTMTEIISAVQRVTDIMGEIAAASEEQSSGIDQVARAVTQMDEVTQQNAALVEEAAAAASSLEEQAAKLRTTVSVFQVDDAGGAFAATPAKRPVRHAAPVSTPRRIAPSMPAVSPAPAAPVASPASAPARAAAAPQKAAATSDADWETF
jgi:methyl-accepting chemotaxis protein-1 (serine sensor receptor)